MIARVPERGVESQLFVKLGELTTDRTDGTDKLRVLKPQIRAVFARNVQTRPVLVYVLAPWRLREGAHGCSPGSQPIGLALLAFPLYSRAYRTAFGCSRAPVLTCGERSRTNPPAVSLPALSLSKRPNPPKGYERLSAG